MTIYSKIHPVVVDKKCFYSKKHPVFETTMDKLFQFPAGVGKKNFFPSQKSSVLEWKKKKSVRFLLFEKKRYDEDELS